MDKATDKFNSLIAEDFPEEDSIITMYNHFKELRVHVKSARINFLASSDLSIDDKSAKESMNAAREMRKILMQIDDIYLPSLSEKLPKK